ncbi:MAG: YicC family protein [Oscillospiraceae bacterium]|nr:YicC family protein [Oscillospiraceae bacterium]
MIKSMTGYGRAVRINEGLTVTVEIKSVNHRFFEFGSKISRGYSFLEDKLKAYLQQYISRGKVDCFVQIENEETQDGVVSINESLAAGYYNALKSLAEKYSLKMSDSVDILALHNDIFNVKKPPADEEKIWLNVKEVCNEAIHNFIEMREKEGEKLKSDVLSRADAILKSVEFIEQRSPETVKEYNEKLKVRIKELIGDAAVDEERLLNEAAVFADKIAVAEETVRLRSHIDQLRLFLETEEPVGRKLDFLVQEINREANTVGSKASDIDIAKQVINIKSEVEKIREQIQNIE